MKALKWAVLLALAGLLGFVLVFGGCDCGDDDDDDNDNDASDDDTGDDDDVTAEQCQAEKSCYEESNDCYMAAQTLADLLACTAEGLACLVGTDACTAEYLLCTGSCGMSEECIDSCGDSYYDCFDTCGWDGICIMNCSDTMDACVDACGLNFDCMWDCYKEGYGPCMDDCF